MKSVLDETNGSGRDQIRQNALVKQYFCDVDIAHLISYDEELADKLVQEPSEIIPLVRCSSPYLNAIVTDQYQVRSCT